MGARISFLALLIVVDVALYGAVPLWVLFIGSLLALTLFFYAESRRCSDNSARVADSMLEILNGTKEAFDQDNRDQFQALSTAYAYVWSRVRGWEVEERYPTVQEQTAQWRGLVDRANNERKWGISVPT